MAGGMGILSPHNEFPFLFSLGSTRLPVSAECYTRSHAFVRHLSFINTANKYGAMVNRFRVSVTVPIVLLSTRSRVRFP
jgi:hypothetical protein